jgi:hypothetical protein
MVPQHVHFATVSETHTSCFMRIPNLNCPNVLYPVLLSLQGDPLKMSWLSCLTYDGGDFSSLPVEFNQG